MLPAALALGLLGALHSLAPASIGAPTPPPQPIYGGDLVDPGTWPEVVALDILENGFLCTGTLVTDRLVLTAAHCLQGQLTPSKIRILIGDRTSTPSFTTVADAYGAHPDYCDDLDACKEDIHDYAWVVLRDPAPPTPAKVLVSQSDWDRALKVDAPITLVGYGEDENGNRGVKRIAETTIRDFSSTGNEFLAGGMGIDSCQGDSGGPAFVIVDGQPLLVGITSRGYDCGEGGFYAVPYPMLCWISDQSGIDVRPADCGTCTCLDTSEAEGCGCRAPADDRDPLLLLAPLGIAALVRARRRASR